MSPWRTDDIPKEAALQAWIDDSRVPVHVRFSGRLDASTSSFLLAVMNEILAKRPAGIVIDFAALKVCDADGARSLTVVEKALGDSGSEVTWLGYTGKTEVICSPPDTEAV
jgi:anti-anti-sigma regulatory factor